ncbi:MAG: NAD(P)H-binding protein [Candidatus Arcticimaribacter sp.]
MKKILLAGSSGMIGQLILQYALAAPSIKEVVSLVRTPSNLEHPKLKEVVVKDFLDYHSQQALFDQVDVVYYCVGVYTGTVDRDLFRLVTIDYPFALATAVKQQSPDCRFVLLSGQGADRKEKSKMMFALDKGIIENKLATLLGEAFYSCRPGYIYPVTPRKEPSFAYVLSRKLYPILKLLGKKTSITSKELALAMFHIGLAQPKQLLFENDHLRDYLESI